MASEQVALTLIMYLALYVVLLLAYVKTLFWLAKRAIEVEEYDLSLPGLPEQKAKLANEGAEA